MPRLVVIGGGAAGMSAASAARRVDPALEVTVLERTGNAGYGMCGLPYYFAGIIRDAASLFPYPAEFFRAQRLIDLRFHVRAVSLDVETRHIVYEHSGERKTLAYDELIVAAGAEPTVPCLPGVEDPRIFTIRKMEDAVSLRGLLDSGEIKTALVVGAGYVGLEMAEALVARGVHVVVAEQATRVMPNLDAGIADLVAEELRSHGVELRLGSSVVAFRRRSSRLDALVDDDTVTVDLVVMAVGVRPGENVAAQAGAATGPAGALLVDRHMRTSLPHVLAAGDCIAPFHIVLRRPEYVPLGPAANKTGRVAGTVAAGGSAGFGGIVGTMVVKVFDQAIASTGITLARAIAEGMDPMVTEVTARSRAKSYPGAEPLTIHLIHKATGELLGAQMLGRDGVAKRIDVVATALHAGLTVDDLAGLDLAYAPPYAPVYDPILVAAQAATLKIRDVPPGAEGTSGVAGVSIPSHGRRPAVAPAP